MAIPHSSSFNSLMSQRAHGGFGGAAGSGDAPMSSRRETRSTPSSIANNVSNWLQVAEKEASALMRRVDSVSAKSERLLAQAGRDADRQATAPPPASALSSGFAIERLTELSVRLARLEVLLDEVAQTGLLRIAAALPSHWDSSRSSLDPHESSAIDASDIGVRSARGMMPQVAGSQPSYVPVRGVAVPGRYAEVGVAPDQHEPSSQLGRRSTSRNGARPALGAASPMVAAPPVSPYPGVAVPMVAVPSGYLSPSPAPPVASMVVTPMHNGDRLVLPGGTLHVAQAVQLLQPVLMPSVLPFEAAAQAAVVQQRSRSAHPASHHYAGWPAASFVGQQQQAGQQQVMTPRGMATAQVVGRGAGTLRSFSAPRVPSFSGGALTPGMPPPGTPHLVLLPPGGPPGNLPGTPRGSGAGMNGAFTVPLPLQPPYLKAPPGLTGMLTPTMWNNPSLGRGLQDNVTTKIRNWLDTIPIGNGADRGWDDAQIREIADFAQDSHLEHLSAEEIYKRYVEHQVEQATTS